MREFFVENIKIILENGGVYIYPLVFITAMLWYFIGYRVFLLRRGSNKTVLEIFEEAMSNQITKTKGVIDGACVDLLKYYKKKKEGIKSKKDLERVVDEVILDYDATLKRYRYPLYGLTVIAPLLGLLGTVDGMITMFASLVDGGFYSPSGGIALGVSKALYTTEIGLVIAIPGIIIGGLLDSKQRKLQFELFELRNLAIAKLNKELQR